MSTPQVEFVEVDGRIDLVGHTPQATIGDLVRDLEAFRLQGSLRTAACAGCGECCSQPIPVFAEDMRSLTAAGICRVRFPSRPDPAAWHGDVETLMRDTGMELNEARSIYEYNTGEPIILDRNPDSTCVFLQKGYCSIYEQRPLTCRIYLCCMGERLEVLQEQIVSRGTWHAYADQGWVDGALCAPNPFAHSQTYLDILLEEFAPPSVDSMEKLFFYF